MLPVQKGFGGEEIGKETGARPGDQFDLYLLVGEIPLINKSRPVPHFWRPL
jgi:hypothetical protein